MPRKAAAEAGSIRKRGQRFQVRVHAGIDPVTGKELVLTGSAGTMEQAKEIRRRLFVQVDEQRNETTRATLRAAMEKWLQVHEVDDGTRVTAAPWAGLACRPAVMLNEWHPTATSRSRLRGLAELRARCHRRHVGARWSLSPVSTCRCPDLAPSIQLGDPDQLRAIGTCGFLSTNQGDDGHDAVRQQLMQVARVFDQGRAKHSVEARLLDERCALCGQLATHALAEQQCLTSEPMTTSLCCEHFTLVVDDCSCYPYDRPLQPI